MTETRFADRLLSADPALGRPAAPAGAALAPAIRWGLLLPAAAASGVTGVSSVGCISPVTSCSPTMRS